MGGEHSYGGVNASSIDAAMDGMDTEKLIEDTLPAWAYHKDASMYMSEEVGPGVPWLRRSAILMLSTQIGIFSFLTATTDCPEKAGVPHYPVVIWAAAIPGLIFKLAAELFALSLFLSYYVKVVWQARMKMQDLPLFKVMGVTTIFTIWLAASLVFSLLNGIDMVTDTLSAATYSMALHCPANDKMNLVWSQTWQQSMLGGLGLPPLNLGNILVFCWVFCLLQTLVPLFTTIRKGRVDYSRGAKGYASSCLTGQQISNGYVFDEMSEANGSASLQSLASTGTLASVASNDYIGQSIWVAREASETMAKRVWLSYIMESSVQASLQATLFGILFYVSDQQMTKAASQSLFSIGLSVGLTLLKLVEASTFRQLSKVVEKMVQDKTDAGEGLGFGLGDGDDKHGRENFEKFRRNRTLIYVGFAILTVSLLTSVLKLCAAFYCKDSMINLTGCAQMNVGEQL